MIRITTTEKLLLLSVSFTLVLVICRIYYAQNLNYVFYAWNLFLAAIPLLLSRKLDTANQLTYRKMALLAVWLLFLPNASYLVTDILHFKERYPVPKWFDMLLVSSAAWNGLLLGFVSMLQVEAFLLRCISRKKVNFIMITCTALCGYGVYIGRFLRFNSWDVMTNPFDLLEEIGSHFFFPFDHLRVWAFSFSFAMMLLIAYRVIKTLPAQTVIASCKD